MFRWFLKKISNWLDKQEAELRKEEHIWDRLWQSRQERMDREFKERHK